LEASNVETYETITIRYRELELATATVAPLYRVVEEQPATPDDPDFPRPVLPVGTKVWVLEYGLEMKASGRCLIGWDGESLARSVPVSCLGERVQAPCQK
jgi:hypothetical protein